MLEDRAISVRLTNRDIEILSLAGEGLTDKEIGMRLGISRGTVIGYWTRLRLKLGVSSRTEAVAAYKSQAEKKLKEEGHQLLEELERKSEEAGALKKKQDELEARVQLRTKELLDANANLTAEMSKRLAMEGALRESEVRYKSLYDDAEVAMFSSMVDGSAAVEMNTKALDLFGGTRTDFVGKPTSGMWVNPEERSRLIKDLLDYGAIVDREVQVRTKQGQIRTCLMSSRLNRQTGVIQSSAVDITERKEIERQLKDSESQLRTILDAIEEPARLEAVSGVNLAVNDAWCELHGVSREEAVGQTLESLMGEKPRFQVLSINEIDESEQRLVREVHIRSASGKAAWYEVVRTAVYGADGGVIAYAHIGRDITVRKEKDTQQQAAIQFALGVLDGISSNVAIVDRTGQIISVNSSWRRFGRENGMSAGIDTINANYFDVCHRSGGLGCTDADEMYAGIIDVLGGRRDFFEMDYRCDSPAEKRWFRARVSPFPGAQDQMVVIDHRNITQAVLSEESLRLANERYSSFVSNSHEAIYCTEFDQPIDTSLPVEEQIDQIYKYGYLGECNDAMAQMYGSQDKESMRGVRLVDAHGGNDDPKNRAVFRQFILNGYRSMNNETHEMSADGRELWFLSNDTGDVIDGYLCRIWGTAVDITEQVATRKNSEKEVVRSKLLLDLLEKSVQMTDKELYYYALDIAVEVSGSKIGFFHLVSEDQQSIILTTWNREALEGCDATYDTHYPLTLAGNWVDCVRLKRGIIYNDFDRSPNRKGLPEGHCPITRFMSVPVVEDGLVKIIFGVGNKDLPYTDADLEQIERVAKDLQTILGNRKLHQDVVESEIKIRRKLDAILDPQGELGNLKLEDVVEVGLVRDLVDSLSNLTGASIGLVDLEGKILARAGWLDVCTKFHRANSVSCQACIESNRELFAEPGENGYRIHKCKNNIWDVSMPVVVGGRQLGILIVGQFFLEGEMLDMEVYREQAKRYGFDETEYMRAIDLVPTFSKEYIERFITFFSRVAGYLSKLSYSNIQIARNLQERQDMFRLVKESEDRYRLVVESIADWVWEIDEHARYTYASEKVEQVLGYRPEALIGKKPFDLMPDGERERVSELFEAISSDRKPINELEHQAIDKDGRLVTLVTSGAPIFDDRGNYRGYRGCDRDITEKKQSEEKLRLSDERFRVAFMTSPDSYIVVRASDGEYLEVNEGFTRISGYTREEALGKTSLNMELWRDETERGKLLELIERKGSLSEIEVYIKRKDGEERVVSASINSIDIGGEACYLIVCKDVTERQTAEQKLRESEANLREASTIAGLGQWSIDYRDMSLTLSDNVYQMLDMTAEQFGSTFDGYLRVVHPDDRQLVVDTHESMLRDRVRSEIEHRVVMHDGTIRWAHLVARPIFDESGTLIRAAGTVQDVTVRKQTENELRRSNERLQSIADNTPDHIVEQDLNLRYQMVINPQLGLTAEDMVGKSDYDILRPEDADWLTMLKREVLETGTPRIQVLSLKNKKGEQEYFEGSYVPKFDKEGKVSGLIGYFKNVTHLRRTIDELENANRLLLDMQKVVQAGSWSRSGDSALAWSDSLFEMLGLDPAVPPSMDRWASVVHPEDLDQVVEAIRTSEANGSDFETRYRIVKPTGQTRWMKSVGRSIPRKGGQPSDTVGINFDITDEFNAEQRQQMAIEILQLLNQSHERGMQENIQGILGCIKKHTGYAAVAIRLRDGNDYPYYCQDGFSDKFIKHENRLGCRSGAERKYDDQGRPLLECFCGLVLSGKTDPRNPIFTPFGSAWSNDTAAALAIKAEDELRINPRNKCVHEGYRSMALIPIRLDNEIIGLLQLNDTEPDRFDLETVQFFEGIGTSIGTALSRTRAQDQLSASERRFRMLFNLFPVGVILVNHETLDIEQANEAAVSMLGYSREEYLTMKVSDIQASMNAEQIKEMVAKIPSGQVHAFETKHRAKSGDIKYVDVRLTVIEIDGRKYNLASFIDQTQKKRLQDALIQKERYHRHVLESLPDTIIRFDCNLNVVYISPNVRDLFGCEPEDVLGLKYRSLPGYDKTAGLWEATLKEAIEAGEQRELELQNAPQEHPIFANWRFIPEFDAKGAVSSVLAVVRDMTAHRKAEKDFAMLFDRMLDGFALHDIIIDADGIPCDYRFLAVNPAFEKLTGLKASLVTGKLLSEVLPGNEPIWLERYGRVALTGEPATFQEYSKPLNRHFEVAAFQPAPFQFATIFVDVSEKVRAEEKLRMAHRELESRVEQRTLELREANTELEKFSYSISHDLRAPLRAINGFAHMLDEDYREKLDDEGQETLHRISSAAKRMGELVDGLLRLSRINRTELNKENVDLSAIVRELAEGYAHQDEGRKVKLSIQEGLHAVGDEALIRSMIDNLVSNAFKYSNQKKTTHITFGCKDGSHAPVYFIRDNGVGFDSAYADRLFTAFQRLHSEKEYAGIGIGLATAKRIVMRHGGGIWAESELGAGATFYFTLEGGPVASG